MDALDYALITFWNQLLILPVDQIYKICKVLASRQERKVFPGTAPLFA